MVKVILNGVVVKQAEEINALEIKEIAKLNGLDRFIVKNEQGELLTPEDFPIKEGEVYIYPYNEMGAGA